MALVLGALVLVLAACSGDDGAQGLQGLQGEQGAKGDPGSTGLADVPDLVQAFQAMAATAPYMDAQMAVAAGYVDTEECVASPEGAMGIHFANFGLLAAPSMDVTKPAVLLYVPTDAGLQLVGLEYMLVIGPPDAPVPDPAPPAPVLFGHTFEGPMVGHGPGQPPHYDLHVWLWEDNPDGIFADFNPSLSCPA